MYKALRTMTVKRANGEYEKVQPGDLVPEAAEWPNLAAYLKRQWVAEAGEESVAKAKAKAAEASAEVSVNEDPTEEIPESVEELQNLKTAEASVEAPVDISTEDQLASMTKKELQSVATELGIDANQTKAELVESILALQ